MHGVQPKPEKARTVLVAEDEMIVAFDLCETVEVAGFRAVGPYARVKDACSAIEDSPPSVALLDVRLEDGDVFPLADRLAKAGVPIIFHSAHAEPQFISRRYPDAILCQKPCPPDRLIEVLANSSRSEFSVK
jgi:DNA-binding NtrC family response regulator